MADISVKLKNTMVAVRDLARRYHISWRLLYRAAVYLLLFDVAYVFLFPFLYMIITSLKSPQDLADFTVNWVPRTIEWSNYTLAFSTLQFWVHFKNALIITGVSVVGHLVSGSFIGYGFARYNFPGSKLFFSLVIISLIIPTQTLIIPMYIIFSKLDLINTFVPLIVPTWFGFGLRGGLFIFIFRQFFIRLPHELEDAAKIDGCNFIRTFWNIVIPISQPAILVSCILGFVWHWHDFYEPSVYLQNPKLLPLPSMLPRLWQMMQMLEDEMMASLAMENEFFELFNNAMYMAATVICLLPILIVFAIVQRYFIQGVERTGLVE